jgi:outer membrane protein assembly factor BamB
MTTESITAMAPQKPKAADAARPATALRLWPVLVLVVAYWTGYAFANFVVPGTFTQFLTMFWSPIILALAILVWWLFFSRQAWRDRFFGVGCLILGGGLATLLCDHKSMIMGMIMYAAPIAITAVILTLAVTQAAPRQARWAALAVASILAWCYFSLIRVDGVTGGLQAERSWRWQETSEDKFLAERKKSAANKDAAADNGVAVGREANHGNTTAELVATASDWPEFRGRQRDGHVHNVSLQPDWTAHPPRELWRRRVGPGWSSFAVVGDRVFTQEQRGANEAVFCFHLATGQEIWSHEDKIRFEEVVAGAGPRATPTFHDGKIYSFGGGGMLNCLDAVTGRKLWSHDATADAKAKESDANIKPPQWGFSSSPLVAAGIVTVFAGGKESHGVLAYAAATGEFKWAAGQGTHGYSSPQLANIGGRDQILIISDYGIEAFEPSNGKLVWEHKWYLEGMFRVVQPHVIDGSQVLIGTGMTAGTRLLKLDLATAEPAITEVWTTKDLKPYFNDFVSLGGYLYGFDNDILVCIDLKTGKKKWKKGRYGHGQALLIDDQGQMLVISDKGEAVLTEVSPDGIQERGKFQAIKGKTWNHPVIAHGKLLIRNGEEMACFEIGPQAQLQ